MKTLIALALAIAACGPGADRTPKKAESQPMKTLAESSLNARIEGGRIFSGGTMPHIVFRDGGTFSIAASREKPLYSIDFDGGKWCDVYADARGLHWKDCKTGKAPLSWVSISGNQLQVLNQVIEDIGRIEARLKKLEGTQPDGPYLPIPDLPCDALDMVYNSEKGWECGKPHDGEVRSNGRCDETAGREVYSATLGQWLCVNAPKPTAPWPGDKAPPPADHRMPGKGGKQ